MLYMSSLRVVRRTWEKSRKAVIILEQNQVRFERRDLSIQTALIEEFKNRTGFDSSDLPQLFIDGDYFGVLTYCPLQSLLLYKPFPLSPSHAYIST